jgi:hypothetical protein
MIDDLHKALDQSPPIGIGHNRPPKEIEPEEIKELRAQLSRI